MKAYILIIALSILVGCKDTVKNDSGKLNIVTTTTMITDMVGIIGDDKINLEGLMGSGVDPHLYKASESDVSKLVNADVIFYNGLHLEGKLEDVFKKIGSENKKSIAVTASLNKKSLIASENFESNVDPHVWFDIGMWIEVSRFVMQELIELDPENEAVYQENGIKYVKELEALQKEIILEIESLPKEKRILVTAHDAFSYFGQAYDFEVVGLQGLSTATEAGVKDVQRISDFIVEKNVKAIFVESSVPRRTIEALQAAVKSKGQDVEIGGTLYSDALGNAGSMEGTYIGMYRHNVKTIVNALR